jgi:tetratricopeptide (TPR) repeat protein
VAAERDRQEALAALNQAEEVLATGDLTAAELALAQAESRIGEDGPADLATLLAAAKRDRDLVRDLREIEDMSWAPGRVSMPDPAVMARRYQAVFARYGLDLSGTDPDAAAAAVQASHVSAALIAGLSEWFSTDPKWPNLLLLLDRLDPDADRAAIRAAIQAGDEGRVQALVKALHGSKVPAWFAVSVGFHPMVPPEDGVRLMAIAWRAHPSDYLLAYRSSRRLGGMQDRIGEQLAWAKVAAALRPDSPFAHGQLGNAWLATHNLVEAEASYRRAIDLSKKYPKYAGAHVGLGNVMLDKGDWDGAEASFRNALAIDPDDAGLHYNMGVLLATRGDLARAEEWYRKAIAMAPKNTSYRQALDGVIERRAELARLEEIAAGRDKPETPAKAIESAIFAAQGRQYGLGVRLYRIAFAADAALADPLKTTYRYWAACDAVRAATGKDGEMTTLGVEEWGYFTGLALKWLREDLALWTSQAKDPQRRQDVCNRLTNWKNESALAPVRDPAWLATMPPTDRKAWEAFWRDVDALLASIAQ